MFSSSSISSYAVSSLLLIIALSPLASSHMEMSQPLPQRSQYNKALTSDNIDYNLKSPLAADGSNFPCHGYQNDPFVATATYTAGQTYQMAISGTVTHGGGSCQLSLSYDNGGSFQVIKSMIGGCPLTQQYDFTIPSFAPTGKALFAWTWFNEIGNREMYMNCAFVQIIGSSTTRRSRTKRQSAFTNWSSLPDIWRANIAGLDQCATVEGLDVVFPSAGPDVLYGGVSSSSSSKDTQPGCDTSSPAGQTFKDTINVNAQSQNSSSTGVSGTQADSLTDVSSSQVSSTQASSIQADSLTSASSTQADSLTTASSTPVSSLQESLTSASTTQADSLTSASSTQTDALTSASSTQADALTSASSTQADSLTTASSTPVSSFQESLTTATQASSTQASLAQDSLAPESPTTTIPPVSSATAIPPVSSLQDSVTSNTTIQSASLNTTTPEVSLNTTAPDVSLNTTAPELSLSNTTASELSLSNTTAPDVSLNTTAPELSLSNTTSPDVSLNTTAPDVSLNTTTPDLSLNTTTPEDALSNTTTSDVSSNTTASETTPLTSPANTTTDTTADVKANVDATATPTSLVTQVSSSLDAPASSSPTTPSTTSNSELLTFANTFNSTKYFPCIPGAFLCTSPTTYLICGGADTPMAPSRSYTGPHSVTGGMKCVPHFARFHSREDSAKFGNARNVVPSGFYRSDRYVGA